MLHCNLENEWFVLRFQLSYLSAPLSGILGPSTFWGIWLYHDIRIVLQFSEVFSDYIRLILQLLLFMISSYCSFHKRVVYWGTMSPVVVLVSRVGKHLVLHVHILALIFGPFLFHSPTLVPYQCTTSLPSLWLPYIFFLVLISGVRRVLSQMFNAKIINYQGKVYWYY